MMQVNAKVAQFRYCAEDLHHAVARLRDYQARINMVWSGPEMCHVNAAIDEACQDAQRAADDLSALSSDIQVAGMAAHAAAQAVAAAGGGGGGGGI